MERLAGASAFGRGLLDSREPAAEQTPVHVASDLVQTVATGCLPRTSPASTRRFREKVPEAGVWVGSREPGLQLTFSCCLSGVQSQAFWGFSRGPGVASSLGLPSMQPGGKGVLF